MSWRNAPSVAAGLAQATKCWPSRSRASDGTIGDAAHAARVSDHNPDSNGIVHAFDLTHDPAHSVDCALLSTGLVHVRDRRIKYIIWNRRICEAPSWIWKPYQGQPHDHHMHVSIHHTAAAENDTSPWWDFTAPKPAAPGPWICGSLNCPGHERPEHRCKPGHWKCGRLLPACDGHSADWHKCPFGSKWHCRGRSCNTNRNHSKAEHVCPTGPWYCGRTQPPCIGHVKPDLVHRCQPGAALLIPT